MTSEKANILIVDDDESVADLLFADLGEKEGYRCFAVTSGERALERLSTDKIDVVLLDLRLPGISGMDVLGEVKSAHPGTTVIVITAVWDVQTAIEAMKIGASDYITKPFDLKKVENSVEAVLREKYGPEIARRSSEALEDSEEQASSWMSRLDDIARGVEMRLGSLIGPALAQTVVDRTIDTARNLGIPKDQIDRWVDNRQ